MYANASGSLIPQVPYNAFRNLGNTINAHHTQQSVSTPQVSNPMSVSMTSQSVRNAYSFPLGQGGVRYQNHGYNQYVG